MAIGIKKYNGSAWVDAVVKKYNGSAWVQGLVKKYSGSAWVQIYPDTVVSTTKTISASSGLQNYRTTWSNWDTADARQGNGSQYGGSAQYYGYLNLDSGNFTGTGSINSVTSATFTGVRNGSGSYNSNQTIYFYRSNVAPSSKPVGTTEGSFTTTTGGPGSGGTMSNRPISVNTNLQNWMNGVGGKKKLYIHSSAAGDFLGIKPNVSVTATYKYTAKMLTFTGLDEVSTTAARKVIENNEIYHQMLAYEDEANMTLNEIIKHRTENNIADIQYSDMVTDFVSMPYTTDYSVDNGQVKATIHSCKDGDVVEYSYDGGHSYVTFGPGTEMDTYVGNLPAEFDKYRHNVHVRVRVIETDEIKFELTIEPKILLI